MKNIFNRLSPRDQMRQDQPFQTDSTPSLYLSRIQLGVNNYICCTMQFSGFLRHDPISFSALFVFVFCTEQ